MEGPDVEWWRKPKLYIPLLVAIGVAIATPRSIDYLTQQWRSRPKSSTEEVAQPPKKSQVEKRGEGLKYIVVKPTPKPEAEGKQYAGIPPQQPALEEKVKPAPAPPAREEYITIGGEQEYSAVRATPEGIEERIESKEEVKIPKKDIIADLKLPGGERWFVKDGEIAWHFIISYYSPANDHEIALYCNAIAFLNAPKYKNVLTDNRSVTADGKLSTDGDGILLDDLRKNQELALVPVKAKF